MPDYLISSRVRDFSEEQAMGNLWEDLPQAEKENLLGMAREMILLREQKLRVDAREKELKPILMAALEANGEPVGPSLQHRRIVFPKPIRTITGFVRMARVSTTVNETKAEAIARRNGIYDRLFKPVMTLDQDAVMVALDEGLLTEMDIDEIFKQKTTYAFTVEDKK